MEGPAQSASTWNHVANEAIKGNNRRIFFRMKIIHPYDR
jgi:hypothetical protein